MRHLVILPDGNRRWAKTQGKTYKEGYIEGMLNIQKISLWAIKNQISFLSFYGFSCENWLRPAEEVSFLLGAVEKYILATESWFINNNIKVVFSGRRDRLSNNLLLAMEKIELKTKENNQLVLNICIDYSGKEEVIQAINSGAKTIEEIDDFIYKNIPRPDAILRTSGEKRLSNFCAWDIGYAELFFVDEFFPELSETTLDQILGEYKQRNRTYGT